MVLELGLSWVRLGGCVGDRHEGRHEDRHDDRHKEDTNTDCEKFGHEYALTTELKPTHRKTWGMDMPTLMLEPRRLRLKHGHVLLCSCCIAGLSAPRPMLGCVAAIPAKGEASKHPYKPLLF